MRSRLVVGSALLILFFAGFGRVSAYLTRQQLIREQQAVHVPEPERISLSRSPAMRSITSPSHALASSSSISPAIRSSVNWDVPFTSQAPFANWDALHKEACEEASVLMVLRYFHGKPIASPEDAEQTIQDLVAKNAALGFPVDDTAEQIVTLIHSLDPELSATLLRNPSEEKLKKILNDGSLVIVPAAGRQLGNPYYTAPGPLYHMLMLRGYTGDGYVITNDPGTKRGAQYVYRWNVLLSANHDWNGGDVEGGAKVVVVVGR